MTRKPQTGVRRGQGRFLGAIAAIKNNWLVGLIGSILGFLLSQSIAFYTFTTNLETTKKIEMINLGKELVQDFYGKDNILFKDIRTSIESCEKLYNGFNKTGKFDHELYAQAA